MPAHVSEAMKRALALIEGGASPAEAARQSGVAKSTISRSRLYRAHVEKLAAAGAGADQARTKAAK